MCILNTFQYIPGVGIGLQEENASPVRPDGQEQMGTWFDTLQSALSPHVPGHGS
jgi:hypothetical protein